MARYKMPAKEILLFMDLIEKMVHDGEDLNIIEPHVWADFIMAIRQRLQPVYPGFVTFDMRKWKWFSKQMVEQGLAGQMRAGQEEKIKDIVGELLKY